MVRELEIRAHRDKQRKAPSGSGLRRLYGDKLIAEAEAFINKHEGLSAPEPFMTFEESQEFRNSIQDAVSILSRLLAFVAMAERAMTMEQKEFYELQRPSSGG